MLLEGQQLGNYRLVRLLGSGGMGEVYLAEDMRIHRQVAIKVMRSEVTAYPIDGVTKQATRLFQREVKAISALDHPHILPLFDFGEEKIADTTLTYMVMPYRQENSLVVWLEKREKNNVLSPQDVGYLVRQAASALQHAHDRQIVHQDVKPSNFLIRNNPENPDRPDLLLADFGVAKFSTATSSMSHSIHGTPTYMAPEQWNAEPVPATDQYALAVMGYELLTGRPPFQGTPMRMMYQHNNVQPEPPSAHNPRIPKDLDEVILHALAKKPEERFASITAFANAFQQAAQSDETPTFVKLLQTRELETAIPSSNAEHIDRTTPVLEPKVFPNTALELDTREAQAPIKRQSTLKGKAILLAGLAVLIILTSVGFFYFAGKNQATSNNRNTVTTTTQTNTTAPTQPQNATHSTGTTTAQAIDGNATATTIAGMNATATATAIVQANATATALAEGNATATAIAGMNATATAIAGMNATATAIAQANATATAVAANANPYPPYMGTLVLNDPMSANDSYSWDVNSYCLFTGGAYHVRPALGYSADCFAHNVSFHNFAYQVQMTILQGDCGKILFRTNGGNFYDFYVCQNGTYDLYLYVNNNFVGTLAGGSASAIHTGLNQTNVVAAVANGSTLTLYVNRQSIASVNDSTLSQGAIGVGGVARSNSTEVSYNYAKVWTF